MVHIFRAIFFGSNIIYVNCYVLIALSRDSNNFKWKDRFLQSFDRRYDVKCVKVLGRNKVIA